ncbi:1-propanol dehydrogenase PduQ [Tessaracoccus sp. OH4464_COT-324]|uniref:1-propanol dehydrogenase PduQ n=1 Tax=Tessaracoccus sp. OH4464_COT-324 TaxID=2491059 RepID=UPI000F63FED1|nr:1-propanol dehydrogenase PduQ [Tessaracoccus sp. OH4464_COT-324]RRD47810.1 iron-containing alcohol dehydrogenase [Tessaracoccus sp. OH4464_COT-324]
MQEFRLNTTVKMGFDSLTALQAYRGKAALVVTDDFLSSTKLFDEIRFHLGGEPTVYSGVLPDPTVSVVKEGVARYLAARPDVVVAFGGGSVMDTAKAMHKAAVDNDFGAPEGIVAIPSTSGSGSEVTSFAVLTDEQTHTKIPLVSADMVAKVAILDPDAVLSLPPRITADSGLDVLTHALEAYVSVDASDFSDALAEKAVELVFAHLETVFRDGSNAESRTRMHNASCMAAMAFDNCGLGITHSLAHALGGHFHIPHGRCNAMLLPHVIEYNSRCPRAAERYARLGHMLSPSATGRAAVTALVARVRKLNQALEVPETVREAGISLAEYRQLIEEMAATAAADGCTPTNPIRPSHEDLVLLLRKLG